MSKASEGHDESSAMSSVSYIDDADGYKVLNESEELQVNRSPFQFNAGSQRSSVFNLCASTIGGGCLSLPNATSKTGILFGGVLLMVFAVFTSFSLRCLDNAGRITSRLSYESMTEYMYGKRTLIFVQINIVVFCLGTCVAYIKAISEVGFTPLQGVLPWLTQPMLMAFVWVCFMFPLSFFNKIDEMRFITLFSVFSVLYLVVAVTAHSIGSLAENKVAHVDIWRFDSQILLAMPTMMFAFTSHLQLPLISGTLVRPNERRMSKVIDRAILLVYLLYVMIGVMAASEFGAGTLPNILQNYTPIQDQPVYLIISFVAICIVVTIAFPLNVFPARFTLALLLYKRSDKEIDNCRYFFLTLVCTLIPLGLALVVPDIGTVFSLIGSTVSAFLCFILPGMFVVSLPIYRGTWFRTNAIGLIVSGTVIGIAGTFVNIYDIITGTS